MNLSLITCCLFIISNISTNFSLTIGINVPAYDYDSNRRPEDPKKELVQNGVWSDSLLQTMNQDSFDSIQSTNGLDSVISMFKASLQNSFTFSHLVDLLDSNLYDQVLTSFDLTQFPLDSYQVQTTIVNNIFWGSRFGHLAQWPMERLKYVKIFLIRGFTVSTLMRLQVPEHSPKNIIALINEPNSISVVSDQVCRYLFYLEKLYNYRSRYYRKAVTGKIQNCVNNEYLLTAPTINLDLIKNVDLTWYQFHLVMMSQPKISASDANLIKHFSINDFEISANILRKIIATNCEALLQISSPLAREFVFQSILYEFGSDFFHYTDAQIRVVLNFLDNFPLDEIHAFRNIHMNAALTSEDMKIKQTWSLAKKQVLLNMYKSGRFSNVKITSKDIENLKWISHALTVKELNSISIESLKSVLLQFEKYPEDVPKVSKFVVLNRLVKNDFEAVESLTSDRTFGYWISHLLRKTGYLRLSEIRELDEKTAHKRCQEVSEKDFRTVEKPKKLAILAALSTCKPNRGRSQWILKEIRQSLLEAYGVKLVNFSRLPDYFEAAFAGEIMRELTVEELETIPGHLCFDAFSKLSSSSMEDVPLEMGRKIVDVYMRTCARRTFLSELDLTILGSLVCYATPDVIAASQRQLINDNLYLFHNCCLPEATAEVIRGHVLKDSIFSRSIIRSLGPSYHSIVNSKLIHQLNNMSSFLKNYILADLSTIVRQGKPVKCGQHTSLDTYYNQTTNLVKENLIQSTKMMKGCTDRKFGAITCPIIKELGIGMKAVDVSDLEEMQPCDITICMSYFASSAFITDQQLETFKNLYLTHFSSSLASAQEVIELGQILPRLTLEELQIAVGKIDKLIEFSELGRLETWNMKQKELLWRYFKTKFNVSSDQMITSGSVNIYSLGHILCAVPLADMYRLLGDNSARVETLQFIGTLQCSPEWFQDYLQIIGHDFDNKESILVMGNVLLGYNNQNGYLDSLDTHEVQQIPVQFFSRLDLNQVSKLVDPFSFLAKLAPEQISHVNQDGFPESFKQLLRKIVLAGDVDYDILSKFVPREEPKTDILTPTTLSSDSTNNNDYEYYSQYSHVIYIFAYSVVAKADAAVVLSIILFNALQII